MRRKRRREQQCILMIEITKDLKKFMEWYERVFEEW